MFLQVFVSLQFLHPKDAQNIGGKHKPIPKSLPKARAEKTKNYKFLPKTEKSWIKVFKAILASDGYHCISCFFLLFPAFIASRPNWLMERRKKLLQCSCANYLFLRKPVKTSISLESQMFLALFSDNCEAKSAEKPTNICLKSVS